MLKPMVHCTLALAMCSLLATVVFAAPKSPNKRANKQRQATTADGNKQKLTFVVAGADATQAAAINKALADSGLEAKVREGKGKDKGKDKGMHLTADVERSADLSPLSKAVSESGGTTKGEAAPKLQLVVYARINKESGTQAIAELEKLKGIDAKHSTADVKKGELHLQLTGEPVTAEEISSTIQSAGVVGQFTKMGGKGK